MGLEIPHVVPGFDGKSVSFPGHANYKIIRRVGTGGFGQVYEASHPSKDRIALKFPCRPGYIEQDAAWSAILNGIRSEYQSGRTLHDSHLARSETLLELNEPGWPPFAIEMYYYAATLFDLFRILEREQKKLPIPWVIKWCRELISGLETLYRRRYVHRDLKPTNVFFRFEHDLVDEHQDYRNPTLNDFARASIVIGDFGFLGAEDAAGLPLNQDDYKPPANSDCVGQALKTHRVNHFEDLHALGKIFKELATHTEGGAPWLVSAGQKCLDPSTPIPLGELRRRVSRDFSHYEAILLDRCGHRPLEHQDFEGRLFVRSTFETFAGRRKGIEGGVFLIVAEAGVGKTALMTNWAEEEQKKNHRSPAAYYFRFRDGRTPAAEMPKAIFDLLKSAYGIKLEWTSSNANDQLRQLFREIAAEGHTKDSRQLIFIDGLDECANPAEAVSYLPRTNLPDGIFLIVSSRPPIGANYLEALEVDGAQKLTIDPMGEENLANLRDFLIKRNNMIIREQAESLAKACGGMFQLAVFFLEDLSQGQVTVEEFLERAVHWQQMNSASKMYAYYEESWKRVRTRLEGYFGIPVQAERCMNELAAVLTAAIDWLSFPQLEAVLPWMEEPILKRREPYWDGTVVDHVLKEFRWLLAVLPSRWYQDEKAGYYQFRHQSIRDFFLNAPAMQAVRALQKKMHKAIGEYYLHEAQEKQYWAKLDPYGRYYTPRHLILADEKDQTIKAMRLMCDLDYLAAACVVDGEESASDSGDPS